MNASASAGSASSESRIAAAVVAAPTPIWLQAPPDSVSSPTRAPLITTAAVSAPTPVVSPNAGGVVDLVDAGFTFIDPPEPGARAQFSLTVRVRGGSGSPIALLIPADWLDGFKILGLAPAGWSASGSGRFVFDLPPGISNVTIDVVARGERIDPPVVLVQYADSSRPVGEAHPGTTAEAAAGTGLRCTHHAARTERRRRPNDLGAAAVRRRPATRLRPTSPSATPCWWVTSVEPPAMCSRIWMSFSAVTVWSLSRVEWLRVCRV
jgi:hypothetical protein